MTMKKSLLAMLSALTLLLSNGPVRAQSYEPTVPPEGITGARRMSTDRIAPRVFRFTDLPAAPNLEDAPITLRPEHEWLEATAEVKRIKQNPPFLPASSFAQFTEDTTPSNAFGKGSLSPLAPTLGTGFEGITQGGFIPGIRPGPPTERHLGFILNRITMPGALFIAAIALVPSLFIVAFKISNFGFAGTSILIAVGVALETMKQIDSQLMMRNYEGFLA